MLFLGTWLWLGIKSAIKKLLKAGAEKVSIKSAVEALFDVQVVAVNTANQPLKKRRVGKFIGKKSRVKRAVVTLAPENSITFFENA